MFIPLFILFLRIFVYFMNSLFCCLFYLYFAFAGWGFSLFSGFCFLLFFLPCFVLCLLVLELISVLFIHVLGSVFSSRFFQT